MPPNLPVHRTVPQFRKGRFRRPTIGITPAASGKSGPVAGFFDKRRMNSARALFIDTSVHISRFFKSGDLKRKIDETVAAFDLKVTGLVVRNEFRRRVLSEAQYLLRLLDRYESAKRVQQHVNDE